MSQQLPPYKSGGVLPVSNQQQHTNTYQHPQHPHPSYQPTYTRHHAPSHAHRLHNHQQLCIEQQKLPVYQYKSEILSAIKANPITLIVGETGSGKTTQIPQYLLEWSEVTPSARIVCTQPRTIAATSVALRVSLEQQCEIGHTVGFHIRLDRKSVDGVTKLEYMTEGVLLRKAMNSPSLSGYKVVIIDEAHERTVNADLLMGFLKSSALLREGHIRVVIMSATLDTLRFCTYFGDPPVIAIPGSLHRIAHHWLSVATEDYITLTMDVVLAIHGAASSTAVTHQTAQGGLGGLKCPDGDILVFLTGQQEIDAVVRALSSVDMSTYPFWLAVHPLYASLNGKDRQKAFDAPGDPRTTRKCVVATNIAETSLTISNVVYVVDCGLSKQKVYSPGDGVEALGIRGISKASVKQRIGRAGRVKPGEAYHLYTEIGYAAFPNETKAEILRSGLVSETLSMLALDIANPLQFDFIDAPDEMTMARAIDMLHHLAAVDARGVITPLGRAMAKFPVNPRMARCLLAAVHGGCVFEMVSIAAMLENVEKLWRRPKDDQKSDFRLKKKAYFHVAGDHLTLLNILNAFSKKREGNYGELRAFCKFNYWDYAVLERAEQIKKQLECILLGTSNAKSVRTFELTQHSHTEYYANVLRCLLSGYFCNVAVQGFGGKYWHFRVLTLNDGGTENNTEKVSAVDIIQKASCHPTSVFYKAQMARNWVIFHQIQISHTTQLRVLSAVRPSWLIETNPRYFDTDALRKDRSPIAKVLIACSAAATDTDAVDGQQLGQDE